MKIGDSFIVTNDINLISDMGRYITAPSRDYDPFKIFRNCLFQIYHKDVACNVVAKHDKMLK